MYRFVIWWLVSEWKYKKDHNKKKTNKKKYATLQTSVELNWLILALSMGFLIEYMPWISSFVWRAKRELYVNSGARHIGLDKKFIWVFL